MYSYLQDGHSRTQRKPTHTGQGPHKGSPGLDSWTAYIRAQGVTWETTEGWEDQTETGQLRRAEAGLCKHSSSVKNITQGRDGSVGGPTRRHVDDQSQQEPSDRESGTCTSSGRRGCSGPRVRVLRGRRG